MGKRYSLGHDSDPCHYKSKMPIVPHMSSGVQEEGAFIGIVSSEYLIDSVALTQCC